MKCVILFCLINKEIANYKNKKGEPMKIVFTVNSYYPLMDGVQSVTQNLAEGLVSKGNEVIVITRKVEGTKDEEEYNGVKIKRLKVNTKYAIHRGNKNRYRNLIKELCKKTDILVNVCTQTAMTDWLFKILDDLNCKKILYMHGMYDFNWNKGHLNSARSFFSKIWNNIRWKLYYLVSPKYISKYDKVIHLHKFDNSYQFCLNKNISNNVIINNSADEVFFSEKADPIPNIPEDYIICVSNYRMRKNQELILKSFYKTETNNYALVFIGSKKTNYYNKLIKINQGLIKKYGKKNVLFLTDVPRNLVYRYVKNAKIYAMGSIWEAFPISIIESMASGVPFISTNVGIVRFLPGGIISDDSKEMAYWFNMLIENKNVAKNIGETGKIYAKRKLKKQYQLKQFKKILYELL